MNAQPNKLINEVSPYLLHHSYNPVNWYPWSDEALELAKKENKLLLISIGYSSCHWCHVMENESFTDNEVAKIMNTNFVCIKVDREERPDIDQIYMNAVQIITRRGGWPLNCFALPDGRPIYGGTYFPKEQWKSILESLNETWIHEPSRVIEVAKELELGIAHSEIIHTRANTELSNYQSNLEQNLSSIEKELDYKNGGTRGAPKFPMPGLLRFLLEHSQLSSKKNIQQFVFTTLNKIANGGIYDQVGGGFFRYSVDDSWRVPHFEKMLYDNAQLIEIFSLAYRIIPNPQYKSIVTNTISFLERELQSPMGGFYSALDADSEEKEGAYYTWTKQELESILDYDSEIFAAAYGITPAGNWENTNVPIRCANNEQLNSLFNLPVEEIEYRLKRSIELLYNTRRKRVPPLIDDKIITSWNALTTSALVQAYITFNIPHYLEVAINCIGYMDSNHFNDNGLNRISCKGKVYANAMLDDYANYIKALLMLYQVTFDSKWLTKAQQQTDKVIELYSDENSGMFFYTPINNKLIVRKMELIDGVIPSANAVMTSNLFQISELTSDKKYLDIAHQMLANIEQNIKNGSSFVYAWTEQFLIQSLPKVYVTLHNGEKSDLLKIRMKTIYPNLFCKWEQNSPNTGFQVCMENSCLKPQSEVDDIVKQINEIKLE